MGDVKAGYDYKRFSTLSGKLTKPPAGRPYRVEYKPLGRSRPVRTRFLALFALFFVACYSGWLMLPSHWPHDSHHLWLQVASIVVTANAGIISLFILVNVSTIARATMLARDPVPVTARRGMTVAFLTTIVPDKEPVAMVRKTLEAAKRIKHNGLLDIWLLDEGDEREIRDLCEELGVNHFTRDGVERWNQPAGPFKARSKHGNYNSWLDAHGEDYEVLISVDPDHVPLPNFTRRFLGYFRDPDVAFVVGPQVYGNYRGFVTRAAESQQFLFHSLLQRAGNSTRTPMLVGTNNAVRVRALKAIGGFHDSVTEDLATSLAFHASRNTETGRRWTSVYTPDVIAVGEGPASFSDYFAQQFRWALGTDEILVRRFWRLAHRLTPRQALHYMLLMSYYPTTAIAWVLGVLSCTLYLTLGAGGVKTPVHLWLMLYADAAALQVGLYLWNRRHNVSPHEAVGSSGIAGMFISMLSTPVYVSSLLGALSGRKPGFVVTSKGDAVSVDNLVTFRKHLQWGTVVAVPLVASILLDNAGLWMHVWAFLSLAVCLTPVGIWRLGRSQRPRQRLRPERVFRPQRQARARRLAEGAEAL